MFETPLDKKPVFIIPLGNLQIESLSSLDDAGTSAKSETYVLYGVLEIEGESVCMCEMCGCVGVHVCCMVVHVAFMKLKFL